MTKLFEDSLRNIVLETYRRYHPKAIFVSSSCATGIIGEDIDSIVEELKEEVNVPIAAVHCEGFKSRIWATGFDISDHAVLSTIVQPPKQKRNTINFKNFYESARNEIIEIFSNFGVEPVFLYANASIEELAHMSEALATVCICGTLGNYLGNGLEEKFGVIFGYKGTLDFAHSVLDTIRNRSFEKNLAKRVKLPYTDWWYQQETGLFLEDN